MSERNRTCSSALLSKTAAQLCSDSRFYSRIGGYFADCEMRWSAAASMLSQVAKAVTEMLLSRCNAEKSALMGFSYGQVHDQQCCDWRIHSPPAFQNRILDRYGSSASPFSILIGFTSAKGTRAYSACPPA